ncbi:MAG: ABC transporter permease subunit [Bdellovibrionota bacterium]
MILKLRQLWAISQTTLREWIRDKFFWVICFLCIFLFSISLVLGEMTFAERDKVLGDLGLLSLEISLCGLAIFAGSYLLSKEIDRQTCLMVLIRPLGRAEFFLGKWLGIASLLFLFLIPSLVFTGFLLSKVDVGYLIICGLSIYLKSLVILSVVMAFSVLVRPLITLGFGTALYLFGHWLEDVKFFAEKSRDKNFIQLANFADWITPNFYKFNWKSFYFLSHEFSVQEVSIMVLHMVSWAVVYILFAIVVFRRKDIV